MRFVFIFILFFSLQACESEKTELIDTQVADRVHKYRAEREVEARLKLVEEASKLVDSFLLDEARRKLQDSLGHIRPSKPFRPEDVPALDSLKTIEPLFHDIIK